jgi:DNA polymerase III alpha subunit
MRSFEWRAAPTDRLRLSRLYPPELLAETLKITDLCGFSLDELRYEYPEEIVQPGHTPTSWLRHETERGLLRRYPQGVPDQVKKLVEHELLLIAELRYEAYFLTVYDIVCFARSVNILCQGRVRRPIPSSASRWVLPRSARIVPACCSNASFRRSAASRRT